MNNRPGAGEEKFRRKHDREKDLQKQRPGDDEDPLPPPTETIRAGEKTERNDPCPCGSGKKYKKCCGKAGS